MKKIVFSFWILSLGAIANASCFLPDTVPEPMYTWQLDDDFYRISPVDLDTMLKKFQVYKPNYNLNPLHSDMGNLALASLPDNYFKRIYDDKTFFFKHYLPFIHYPNKQTYFNTKKPFLLFEKRGRIIWYLIIFLFRDFTSEAVSSTINRGLSGFNGLFFPSSA